jgi:hypothetical protein
MSDDEALDDTDDEDDEGEPRGVTSHDCPCYPNWLRCLIVVLLTSAAVLVVYIMFWSAVTWHKDNSQYQTEKVRQCSEIDNEATRSACITDG